DGSDIARFSFAGRTAFLLKHPDYVDHVLHAAVDRYHKSREYEMLRSVVGLSLFTDEDESWRRHRMMLNPVLAKRHVEGPIDRMVWDVVHERQASPKDTKDLLGLLLSVRDETGARLPLRRVRDEATTFMLAGHETTANALAWMWYLLALNEEARERMLAEVDSVLGGRRPVLADLKRLPWTTACFQEAMRMFPPAWVIPRECVKADVIDGHRIRKGASVLIPIYTLHHDERFWPDPEVFDPTRSMPEHA